MLRLQAGCSAYVLRLSAFVTRALMLGSTDREQNLSTARHTAVSEENLPHGNRASAMPRKQLQDLAERITTIEAQLEQLRGRPAELETSYAQLLTELSDAEANARKPPTI